MKAIFTKLPSGSYALIVSLFREDTILFFWFEKNVDNVIGRIKRNARLLEEFYLNDFKTTLRNIAGQLIFENVEFQRL